ncbi:MAG: CHASE domain-containing protein [Verrucomicrobia bacterium]|nr:CHASE domain-containing protein [Verrucomicrobiota bacterium]
MRELRRILTGTTPGQVLLVALAYYAAGRLGLLLAVPPGYATAVWPPSGLALAGMLHFGYRAWPGVWLGSFCVNSTLAGAAADPAAQWSSTAIAAVIGLGAAAQAVAGSWLVRTWVGYPAALTDVVIHPELIRVRRWVSYSGALAREGEVFRFMVLAGPASCLIGSTWGVGVLTLNGLMPWANAPFNWLTWWVGDTIGVLIFTPLVMMFTSEPAALWRQRRRTVLVPLVVTFVLSVVLFSYSRRWEQERQQAAFAQRAAAISYSLAERMTGYLEVLYAVERFYESSPEVSREQFHTFVKRALARFPGIRALEWIPRVAAADRAATEEAARVVFPQFQFTEQSPGGSLVRAGERAEYFPVLFVEPLEGNENPVGFDIGSETMRREALHRARDTGRVTVTERIGLVLGPGRPAGVLVLLPVYERGFTAGQLTTVAVRREKLRGYVLGVFTFSEMVRSSLLGLSRDGLALGLWDLDAGVGKRELFATQPLDVPQHGVDGLNWLNGHSWTSRHKVGGRTWLLEIRSTQAFLAHSRGWQSWVVLAGSLLFTSLLGILLLVTTGRTVTIEAIVEERTSALNRTNALLAQEIAERVQADLRLRQMNETLEQRVAERTRALKDSEQAALNMMADAQAASRALHDSEERFRLVVESAPNAMIMVDAQGRMALVNAQTEQLFGYARQELLGQLIEVLVPERYRSQHPGHRTAFFHAPQSRAMGAGRDLFGLCKDGREVPVEIGINPISTPAGTFVLASIINITERKRAEEQLRASLREKEVLLQEIHHRVKNNLQIVSSLLRLQSRSLEQPESVAAFEESCARVQSIALVHEKLYDASSFAELDFAAYVQSLTDSLLRSYGTDPAVIRLRLDMAKVHLDINQAIPCALILNELVSNSLKYAFPDGRHGEIWLRLCCDPDGTTHMVVGDNGVGLPERVNPDKTGSLGLQLVNTLVRQLRGTLEVRRDNGIEYAIAFMAAKNVGNPITS